MSVSGVIPSEKHGNARDLAKESPLQLLVSLTVLIIRAEITYQSMMIIWGCISRGGPVSWFSLLMRKGLYEMINQGSHRAEQYTNNK